MNQLSAIVAQDQLIGKLHTEYKNNKSDDSKKKLTAAVVRKLNEYIENKYSLDTTFLLRFSNRISNAKKYLPANSKLFRRLVLAETIGGIEIPQSTVQYLKKLDTNSEIENRSVRVVDLFPRQSSLNVNDLKLRNRATSLKGIFSLLSGFGAQVDYQRSRERYSQYVQQELYSSAFGKGSKEFGWTFNPMPGTNRLLSGVRTTYAILVIPEDTTAVVLEAKGCYFDRKSPQPTGFHDVDWNKAQPSRGDCSAKKKFVMPIPDGGSMNNNDFEVTAINYQSVPKGRRAVVTIYGKNFSSQIGVLINGVPLTQALGLGQPFILDDRTTRDMAIKEVPTNEVNGSFERIGANQIVTSFKMDAAYEGTPTITLVSPGKALDLNKLKGIKINGEIYRSSNCEQSSTSASQSNTHNRQYGEQVDLAGSDYIFGNVVKCGNNIISIDQVTAFSAGNTLKFVITGKNLSLANAVYINGQEHRNFDKNDYLISLDQNFTAQVKDIHVTLLTEYGAVNANPIANPIYKPEKSEKETPNYDIDESRFSAGSEPSMKQCIDLKDGSTIARFEVTGKGLNDSTTAHTGDVKHLLDFISSTKN